MPGQSAMTRPSLSAPPGEQRHCCGTVIGSVIAVDTRGAAELCDQSHHSLQAAPMLVSIAAIAASSIGSRAMILLPDERRQWALSTCVSKRYEQPLTELSIGRRAHGRNIGQSGNTPDSAATQTA